MDRAEETSGERVDGMSCQVLPPHPPPFLHRLLLFAHGSAAPPPPPPPPQVAAAAGGGPGGSKPEEGGEIEGMGDEFAPPEQPRCFWGSRGLPLEGGAFVAFSLLWLEGQRLKCLPHMEFHTFIT